MEKSVLEHMIETWGMTRPVAAGVIAFVVVVGIMILLSVTDKFKEWQIITWLTNNAQKFEILAKEFIGRLRLLSRDNFDIGPIINFIAWSIYNHTISMISISMNAIKTIGPILKSLISSTKSCIAWSIPIISSSATSFIKVITTSTPKILRSTIVITKYTSSFANTICSTIGPMLFIMCSDLTSHFRKLACTLARSWNRQEGRRPERKPRQRNRPQSKPKQGKRADGYATVSKSNAFKTPKMHKKYKNSRNGPL